MSALGRKGAFAMFAIGQERTSRTRKFSVALSRRLGIKRHLRQSLPTTHSHPGSDAQRVWPIGRFVMYYFIRSGFAQLLLTAVLALNSGFAASAPKAYVGNFADNTVSVIDTASNKVIATIPVAEGPHGMAISGDGRTVYVAGDGSSSLSIIETATDRVVKTVEVGKTPNGLALTPDGKLLLVTIYGEDRLAFLDIATGAV